MAGYTDTTPMPSGKYIGRKLIDVPADYLLWLYDNNRCNFELKMYIKRNLAVLYQQSKTEK